MQCCKKCWYFSN